MAWPAGPLFGRGGLPGFQEAGDFTVRGEVSGESPGHLGGSGHVALAHLDVPERELRFGVRVERRLDRGGAADRRHRALPAAPAEDPTGAPRHPGVDDVVDPGTRDDRADVLRVRLEDRVERVTGLPVLVPSRLPA